MHHHAEMRRCLEDVDVAGIRALWAHVSPNLPQPKTDDQALVVLHHARTQAQSIPLKLRAYSHRWLLERGYPTGLPDQLKPSAERLYPRVEGAVGISVNIRGPLAPAAPLIRVAMEDAVKECYADGHKTTDIVKPRMMEARSKAFRQVLGKIIE